VEIRTGAIVKKIPEFCSVGGARSQNSIFRVLMVPFGPSTILRTTYRKQFYPKPMVLMEAETLKVCLLLDYRVYDQAFGTEGCRKVVT